MSPIVPEVIQTTAMRLLRYARGKFTPISMHKFANQTLNTHEVEECIRRNVNMDGSISSLCIDFSGGHVPLVSEEDVRLTAALLCMYHNSILQPEAMRPDLPVSVRNHDYRECHREKAPRDQKDHEAQEECQDTDEHSGVSDDEEQKEYQESLAFEYEQNADIDTDPCFGKAGMEHHMW
jgi:hypothetical protein